MAPSKKDVRKNAWAWAENAPMDYKISAEDAYKVYRMDVPKCQFGSCKRNCRGNPFCLTAIGEARWLNEAPESVSDIDDPAVEKRQEKNFVGLKNLGATCYVNSLLQLWFHNSAFREAIFSWDPLHDPQESENPTLLVEDGEILFTPLSVVGHLQVLFAMLALSKKRTVDPTDFVTSLGLDTSEQQDAQEFSKLFLSLLENKLRDQINPSVTNFIQHNFCGEYAYVTRCSKCLTESTRSSQFYELDLNILGMKTLKESLADFLKEEKLDGPNMYFCGVCNEKQNAERFIKLKNLPPTLCFQLMRFVFDRQKGKKKKLTSHLQFPETVDMTEYIEGATRPYIYNLSAVLIHKGPGAHSGHYIAHILTSQGWYKFNDEYIENMDGKKLKFGEDDLDEFPKKSKSPRVPKGSLASSNAYMLVYTLQKEEVKEDAPVEDIANAATLSNNIRQKLNPEVLRVVEEKNNEFNKWVEEITECRNTKIGQNLQFKEDVASVVRLLPVEEETFFDVVPYSWLNQWLMNDGSKPVAPIDNSVLLCAHNKMNPSSISDAKYICSVAADTLYEQFSGGPRLKLLQDECITCINNEFTLLKLRAKTLEEQKTITQLTKNKMDENEDGFWVSKRWLKSWRRAVLERTEKRLSATSTKSIKNEEEQPSSSTTTLNGNNGCSSANSISPECNSNSECKELLKLIGADESPTIESSSGKNKYSARALTSSGSVKARLESKQRTLRRKHRFKPENEELSSSSEPHSDQEKSETETSSMAMKLTSRSPSISFSPRTRSRICTVKNCYSLLLSVDEAVENVKTKLFDAEGDDENTPIKSNIDKSVQTIAAEVGSIRSACKHILDNIINKKNRSKKVDSPEIPFDKEESKSDLVSASSSNCADICDSEGDLSPVLGRSESVKRANDGQLYNGCTKRVRSDFSMKAQNDNERLDEFEELNDDIVCEHGNLCFPENFRRLVPLKVWSILKSYFPLAKFFSNKAEPCSTCEGLACQDEVAKYRLRQEALKQKDLLGDLLLRISNDSSKLCTVLDDRPVYLVSTDFISDWRKFIRGATKNEPPSSLDNRSLLCGCGLLLYNPEEESERSRFVAVTEDEWQLLSSLYLVHGVIKAYKHPETSVVQTEPDVCQTCLVARLEKEHREQLTYTAAKIFIRFVQDISPPGSDDQSTTTKKPKLNNGTSLYVPPGLNGCSSTTEVLEVRRSSRPRRGRWEKEIVVSSEDTIKDIKVKIFQMVAVAPYDQQLSKLNGEKLEDNEATLASMGIFPSSILLAKFTENAAGDASVSEFLSSAPVEAGFKGTELMKTF